MDTDAMHLWRDKLHGELSSRYEVYLVLQGMRRRDAWLHNSLCHRDSTAALESTFSILNTPLVRHVG